MQETASWGNQNGNGTVADAFVTAFGAGGQSLGTVAVSGGNQNVSDLFSGQPLSSFSVQADDDSQRIGGLSWTQSLSSFSIQADGDNQTIGGLSWTQSLSSFSIQADGDSQIIASISFEVVSSVPEPSSGLLISMLVGCLTMINGRRLRDQRSRF